MGKKGTDVTISIDLSGLSEGLKEAEALCKKTQGTMTTGWENANVAIGTLTGGLSTVNEAWKGWTASSQTAADTLGAFAQTGTTIGDILVQLGTGFATSGIMATAAVPGVVGFGAALNTASGVIGLIATGINLVTTLFEALSQSSDVSAQKISKTTEALTSTAEEMISSSAESNAAFLQTTGAIDSQADRARNLSSQLENLRASGDTGTETQKKMKEITHELVGMYPELISMVNQYTGILEGNGDMVDRVINAEAEYAKTQAMKERGIELTKEMANAEAALYAMSVQKQQNNKKIEDSEKNLTKLNENSIRLELAGNDAAKARTDTYDVLIGKMDEERQVKDAAEQSNRDLAESEKEINKILMEAEEEHQRYAEALNAQTTAMIASYEARLAAGGELTNTEIENMKEMTKAGAVLTDEQKCFADEQILLLEDRLLADADYIQQIKDGKVALAEADMEELERKKILGEELTSVEQAKLDAWLEKERAAKEAAQQLYDERVAMTQNMFERINVSEAQSLETLAGNLEHNQELVDGWSKNLGTLADANIDAGLLQTLRDAGPEAAGTVQKMVDDLNTNSGKGMDKFNELWKNGSKVAIDSMKNEMGLPTTTGVGADTVNQIAQQTSANAAFQEAMKKQVTDAKFAMDEQVKTSNFKTIGETMLNEIASGMSQKIGQINESLPSITIKVNKPLLPTFALDGKFDVKIGSVPNVYVSGWYDKGGLFNTPQLIGIAERRPEFVGAAEDLESFISKAVNNSFVRIDPAMLYDIGSIGGGSTYGGDTIHFNPQVTINAQKLTDAELRRATDYVSHAFAKMVTGRKVGRI